MTEIKRGYPKAGRKGDASLPSYMAFAAVVTDEAAIAAFEKKYAAKPRELYRGKVVVEVGPIPDGNR